MNKFARVVAVASGTALSLVQSAHAALPAGAAEAIEAYETDMVAALGLLIAAGIAIFAVRKLGQKMGWF